jgi:hypothetical protein
MLKAVHRDPITETLLDALRQALAEPGEHRLYRSGKLDGLFPGRGGVNVPAVQSALNDGLLEPVRTEKKGKTEIRWVRITPRGVDFLHERESPLRALEELRFALRCNQRGLPEWLAEMRAALQSLDARLEEEASRWTRRLAQLEQRVEEALRRLEAAGPLLPAEVIEAHPWAIDALNYLDRRRTGGAPDDCALPELFAALVRHHPTLSLGAFHEGLRRLHERRALRLRPANNPADLAQPEYALLDEVSVLYYAAR